MLDVLGKYTGAPIWRDYDAMLDEAGLDAVIVATPSRLHAPMVREGARARAARLLREAVLPRLARVRGRSRRSPRRRASSNQVGYHYRYVGAFQEMKRLVDAGAIGEVTHVLAEAYGPVVLKPKGATWRTDRAEGGGCLYDYAAHPINLVNWCFGLPAQVTGTILNAIFSADTDDEVYATFGYPGGLSVHLSVNWSDESYRKMSTKITLTGTKRPDHGRPPGAAGLSARRRRGAARLPRGLEREIHHRADRAGVRFYLRGEEYSAQIDDFVAARRAAARARSPNDFASRGRDRPDHRADARRRGAREGRGPGDGAPAPARAGAAGSARRAAR